MSLVLFIVPQVIVRVINLNSGLEKLSKPDFGWNILPLLIAAILPMLWILVPKDVIELREVNFIQHSVGGGVAVGLVAIYFINSLKTDYPYLKNLFFQFALFYALVCTLGVTNEILEFFLDYTGLGIFSADRYDTWYDLVANTVGAMAVFMLFKLRSFLYRIMG